MLTVILFIVDASTSDNFKPVDLYIGTVFLDALLIAGVFG